jgi:putative protease
MRHKTELLAPAGSYDSLVAAVNAGADAVYIGGTRFGARAYADNPGEDDLCRAIRYAHLHDCDLYLTVNTLLKDRELEELGTYLSPYYESGLDAVIVQDLGVLAYIREHFPDLAIHASTQMTILGAEGAAFLKELGAERIVTARELSLQEINRIHSEVDIEIESFVHGALCYCYSGQCLFSSMLGGRSGNRGRCAQPCRLPYQFKSGGKALNRREEAYLLSPRDMCTIELLPEILEAGVCSLKIEGRMKRPEYTAGVVRIYRKYLDYYLEHGKEGYHVAREDYRELQSLYNRGGFSQGYYKVQNGRNMISLSRPNHFEGKGKAAIQEKQAYEALLARLKKDYVEAEKKEKIQGIFRISTKNPTELVVECHQSGEEYPVCVSVTGEPAQVPQKQPMTEEALSRQLQKTGGTPFEFERLTIQMEEEVFLPVQQLNRMRREALEALAEKLSTRGSRSLTPKAVQAIMAEAAHAGEKTVSVQKRQGKPGIHVQLDRTESLQDVLQVPEVSKVYLTSEQIDMERLGFYVESCHKAGKECVLVLPAIFRTPARSFFLQKLQLLKKAGLDAVVVKNLEEPGFLKETGWEVPMILDYNMYTFNRQALKFWGNKEILYDTLPLELNERELRSRGCGGSEMLVYGYLPLMVTAGCLHKTVETCDRRECRRSLTDRYQKEFPVMNYCRYCYNMIYNCEPLSLLGSREEVERIGPASLRLCFTMESREEVRQILHGFVEVYRYDKSGIVLNHDFTKGHLKRGVE